MTPPRSKLVLVGISSRAESTLGMGLANSPMIEETHLLCDRIQKLIEDAAALIQSDSLAEKRKQLQQISVTVENLTRANVAVPQELAALSDSLSKEVSQHDVAVETLKTLYERLDGFTDSIEPLVRVRGVRKRIRRGDLPEITPEEDYHPVIIDVLRTMGGSGTAHKILDAVFQAMERQLLPGDLEMYPNSDCENWRRTAKIARYSLMDSGVLRADSPRKTWELASPNGSASGDEQ